MKAPSGTVTFLFTDIEGSTRLWEEFPDAMRAALADHDEVVRDAIVSCGGHVVKTTGDGFHSAFGDASSAVRAAVAAQRGLDAHVWPATGPLRVRMGIDTGEADERDGDYFGRPVNRAARLMAAAHGGQIVASAATAAVLTAPPGVALVDQGFHRLRGLAEPMQVFRVHADGLVVIDQPLDTEQTVPGNLPRSATEYVGRVDLLRSQAAQLASRRLVTLTGTGGVGKTRTAIEAGWLSVDAFPNGVWLVELAPIADSGAVVAGVASVLSVYPQAGMSMLAAIVDWLRGRRLLLILDNCEHVLGAAAELVSAVIAGCPSVTVLATSREPLGVAGERVVPIASLDAAQAEELFRDRAQSADASLELTSAELETVGRICARLDGIPLAIELAAARVRSLTLDDLAARLDDRFRLLRGSGRGGSERHQTLRAAVAWSYQLLSEAEQVVFDRVSVFAGGFDLEAAEAVCSDELVDVGDVVDLVGSLVDKSMVVADRADSRVRYRVLETLRVYGEERLDDRNEIAALRDRHLAYYLAAAQAARSLQMGPRQLDGDAVFERDWDNIRAARAWATDSGQLGLAEDLLIATYFFAFVRLRHEVGDWAEQLLAKDDPQDPRASSTFLVAGGFRNIVMDFAEAIRLDHEAIERGSDPESIANAWQAIASALVVQGNVEQALIALEHAEKALTDTDEANVNYWVRWCRVNVSVFSDPTALPAAMERLTDFAQQTQAPWMLTSLHNLKGTMSLGLGDYEQALEEHRAAFSIATKTKAVFDQVFAAIGIINALLSAPDATPTPEIRSMLSLVRDTRTWYVLSRACELIANHLARTGHLDEASTMLGYLERYAPAIETGSDIRNQTTDLVRGHPRAQELRALGAAMGPAEFADYTIAQLPEGGAWAEPRA